MPVGHGWLLVEELQGTCTQLGCTAGSRYMPPLDDLEADVLNQSSKRPAPSRQRGYRLRVRRGECDVPHHVREPAAIQAVQEIALKVTEAIGGRGLFGVELFVQGGNVWFSEVSPRPHDTGMATMITQQQNEFDLHARAILDLPVDTRLLRTGASAVILSPIEATDMIYDGLAAALAVPDTEVRLFGKPRALINRRMGVALASADTI